MARSKRDNVPEREASQIETTAQRRLFSSGIADLKNIACRFDPCGRTLTLRGRVSLFYLKQLAQEIVRDSENVGNIVNRIEVGAKDL
jgi:hypothetical protein